MQVTLAANFPTFARCCDPNSRTHVVASALSSVLVNSWYRLCDLRTTSSSLSALPGATAAGLSTAGQEMGPRGRISLPTYCGSRTCHTVPQHLSAWIALKPQHASPCTTELTGSFLLTFSVSQSPGPPPADARPGPDASHVTQPVASLGPWRTVPPSPTSAPTTHRPLTERAPRAPAAPPAARAPSAWAAAPARAAACSRPAARWRPCRHPRC